MSFSGLDPEAELLKVAPQAPLGEIKAAYRRAALAHHPDQNPHPDAARHFRRLTEAYRILEARAKAREPAPPPRAVPPEDRLEYLLGDLGTLVKRWPPERWLETDEGLPAGVWAAGIFEALAHGWPGLPEGAEGPRPDQLRAAWERWNAAPRSPAPAKGPGRKAALAALEAAEARVRRLAALGAQAPRRRRPRA